MGRTRSDVRASGSVEAAQRLWHDVSRWPAFVDGFGHVVSADASWPASGTIVWDSRPGGRGRVLERAVAYAPGEGQDVEVEDARIRGVQTVRFAPDGAGCVRVSVELRYALKETRPWTPLLDLFFVRRAFTEALHRTTRRFAAELAVEQDFAGD
jgi:hypothetical protein